MEQAVKTTNSWKIEKIMFMNTDITVKQNPTEMDNTNYDDTTFVIARTIRQSTVLYLMLMQVLQRDTTNIKKD